MGIAGKAISRDIRRAIVRAYGTGKYSYGQVAELLDVGEATVSRVLRRFRETGDVEPLPHGGGAPRVLSKEDEQALWELVEEHNDWSGAELTHELGKRRGIEVSRSTVDKTLRQNGYSRKKRPFGPQSEPFPGFSNGVLTSPVLSERGELIALFSWTKPASTPR